MKVLPHTASSRLMSVTSTVDKDIYFEITLYQYDQQNMTGTDESVLVSSQLTNTVSGTPRVSGHTNGLMRNASFKQRCPPVHLQT